MLEISLIIYLCPANFKFYKKAQYRLIYPLIGNYGGCGLLAGFESIRFTSRISILSFNASSFF